MTRPKRKLNTKSSSGSLWPWVVGVAILLVLLVGIGLGIALTGGNEKGGGAGGVDPLTGLPTDAGGGPGAGTDIGSLLNGTGTGGTGTGTGDPVVVVKPPKADPKLLKFISENTVYLVGTTNGRFEMRGPENRSDLLGDFFKALKAHDTKHGTFSPKKGDPPAAFSPATYAIGTDPINLKASQIIKYNAKGGTPVAPFHYHLDKMTIVMHNTNPAKKDKGIAFNFPGFATWGQAKRPWIHIAGKKDNSIKPFYLVPLETTRAADALINLTVGGGIQFDDKAMTAKANPKTESAMKKLLNDNGLSGGIKFWAGAPLAKWGSAHVNSDKTINFKVVIADKKAILVFGKNNIEAYKTNVKAAIDKLFPAAQAESKAKKEWVKARTEVGEAFKKGQALEGAGNQHLAPVKKAFKDNGYTQFQQLRNLFQRKDINEWSDLKPEDFQNPNFKSAFAQPVNLSPSEQITMAVMIERKCKKYLDAKKKYFDAEKIWQEKVKALNQKQAVLTQKSNANATVINQLKGSPVGKETIVDATKIFQGKMTLDAAKKKWQKLLDKAASRDWAKEIAQWDDPNHQKTEWNKFKKHPAFYLGTSSGTLIRFSK